MASGITPSHSQECSQQTNTERILVRHPREREGRLVRVCVCVCVLYMSAFVCASARLWQESGQAMWH